MSGRADGALVDAGNEDLHAQLKKFQYEVDAFRQEKEMMKLRHEKELRDVQAKAEADFKRAQVGGPWYPGLDRGANSFTVGF